MESPPAGSPSLDRLLPPATLLGVAAGCFGLEQILLALAWFPPHGWLALCVAPALGVFLPLAWLSRVLETRAPAALGLARPRGRDVLVGACAGLGALGPVYAAGRLSGIWFEPPEHLLDLHAGLLPIDAFTLVAGAVAICAVAPLAEEILFRGLAQRALARLAGLPVAVVASGLLFGAAHGALWLAAPITVLGVFLGILAARTGGLVAPWIAHGVFNGVAYVELCVTGDAATDAVARFATQPAVAVASSAVLGFALWWAGRSRSPAPDHL